MIPDVDLAAVNDLLLKYRRVTRDLRTLKRAYELAAASLAADKASITAQLEGMYAEHGTIVSPYGQVRRSTSVTTVVTDSVLTEWAVEHRPGLLRPPTQEALKAAGAKWRAGKLWLEDGEMVPGIEQKETPSVTVSIPGSVDLGDEGEETL